MLCHVPILLVEHVQRLPVEHQIFIIDLVWKLPALGMEVDFPVVWRGGCGVDVGDEVVLLVRVLRRHDVRV